MAVLRCFHRFCSECIIYLKSTNQSDCPICARFDALTSIDEDHSLTTFIATHFDCKLLNDQKCIKRGRNSSSVILNSGRSPLIPKSGLKYYHQQIPAYLTPAHHIKHESDSSTALHNTNV